MNIVKISLEMEEKQHYIYTEHPNTDGNKISKHHVIPHPTTTHPQRTP